MRVGQPGTHNDPLNRAAFNLGTLCGAGRLDRAQVAAVLAETARHAGLSEREAEAAIRLGMAAGERHPRALSGVAA
ncbi:hypothetical protein [Streptomyces sp. NPDC006879]|uniref:hypothetical protein n=1 Tax=Streptomyces sp. NPDC006879 TaxID=3364767 RepID=UPI00369450B9